MIGIISSTERFKDISDAVMDQEVLFQKTGQFNSDEFIHHCHSAAAINLSMLLVDIDCADGQSLIKGLRIFRSSRPARIILIAPGRVPGDPTIASLLSLQVWDIVAPELPKDDEVEEEEEQPDPYYLTYLIKQQIQTVPSYGNAARWDAQITESPKTKKHVTSNEKPNQAKRNESIAPDPSQLEIDFEPPPVREKVTIQETIVGTVFIAVIGAEHSSGTTHTSLIISNFLTNNGYKVAIVEANSHRDFQQIENVYEGLQNVQSGRNHFKIHGLEYYKSGRLDITELKERAYDYIVLDLGCYEETEHLEEFLRAQVQIVTAHGSEWRQPQLYKFYDQFNQRDQTEWSYLIPFADNQTITDIKKVIRKSKVVSVPVHPDPWEKQDDTDNVLYQILVDFIGKRRKKYKQGLLYASLIVMALVIVALLIYIFTN